MKEVHKIVIKEGSDFWKAMQKAANLDPEQAAAEAAERARKEVEAKIAKRDAERKVYLDSLKEYDKLEFKSAPIRLRIEDSVANRKHLQKQVNEEYALQHRLEKEIQDSCSHEMVIERRTSWRDEYDQWHEGHYERKCVECFLVEEQKNQGYVKLAKSQRVLLRRIVDGKEYELEFDDLKWG
jgi:hypothetical protein